MFYDDVFNILKEYKVRYVVVGGTAVNLHGVPRFTADLDLIIDLEKENVLKFIKALRKINFKPKIPVNGEEFAIEANRKKWMKEKGMVVFSFHNLPSFEKTIDVFVKNPIEFEKLFKRRILLSISDLKISLISLDDLIVLKKLANRKQDISDIEALKKVRKIHEKDNE